MVFVTGQVCLTFMFSKFLGLSFYVKPNIAYPWQVLLGTDFFFFISKVCVPYQGQILKSVRCLNMPMQLYEGLHYGVGPTQPWKRSRNVCKY